jgi:6-methylsalicylate decarboxylase
MEADRTIGDRRGAAYRPAMAALTQLVPTTQILLGGDNPFVPLRETVQNMTELELSAAYLQGIGRDNGLLLRPRLKTC